MKDVTFEIGDRFDLSNGDTATLTKELGNDLYEVRTNKGFTRVMCAVAMRSWPVPLSMADKEDIVNGRDPTRRRTNENLKGVFRPEITKRQMTYTI